MAILFDATTNGGSFTAQVTKTVTHTATGSNLIAIVDLAVNADVTGVSATYNGVAMTLVGAATGSALRDCHMFYIVNPPTGAANAVVSWTGSASGWVHVRTYTGVDQTAPIGTAGTAFGTGTTPTVTVSSFSGELVVDALATNATATVGAGQTSRYIETTSAQSAGSDEPGDTSVTMSWSISSTLWAIVAVPLKPTPSTNYLTNYRPRKRVPGAISQ